MSREILIDDYNKIMEVRVPKIERTKEESDLLDFTLVLLLNHFGDDMKMWYFYNLKGVCYNNISEMFDVNKKSIGNKFLRINNVLKELASNNFEISTKEIQHFKKIKKIPKQKALIIIKFLKVVMPKQYEVYCEKKVFNHSLKDIQRKHEIKTKKTVYDYCDKIKEGLKFKKSDYNKLFI